MSSSYSVPGSRGSIRAQWRISYLFAHLKPLLKQEVNSWLEVQPASVGKAAGMAPSAKGGAPTRKAERAKEISGFLM